MTYSNPSRRPSAASPQASVTRSRTSLSWCLVALLCGAGYPLGCTSTANRGASPSAQAKPSEGSADRGSHSQNARLDLARPLTRIGAGSCLQQGAPQPILDAIHGEDFDLFLFMGDNVYGDFTPPSLEPLQNAYEVQGQSPGLAELRSRTPLLATWDDHDFGTNDGGADFAGRAAAQSLFETFWKAPPGSRRDETAGIYDSVIIGPPGQRVQVILLDTRYFRSPWKPSPEPSRQGMERYIPDPDTSKTMLGEEQWSWLADQLSKPAQVRLLVSSIQVVADGHGWEAWRQLPHERQRLDGLIQERRASGVIILSGDRHRAGIYRQPSMAGYPLYELTTSSLNLPIQEGAEEPGPLRLGPTYWQENYGLVSIDWPRGRITLEVRDLVGQRILMQDIELADLQLPPATP